MLLTTVFLVSDDFQNFFNNQSNISDLLNPAVISNIGEIHYHKRKQNKWSKQIEFSAESNQFETKIIKSGNK